MLSIAMAIGLFYGPDFFPLDAADSADIPGAPDTSGLANALIQGYM